MDILHVSLFGHFHARYGEQDLTGLEARKVQELFCYLLLFRDRSHPREVLANVLWGDSPSAQSRQYLRKALWQLQNALEAPAESPNGRPFLAEPDSVYLNPEAQLWLDVAVFEETFALVQGVRGRALVPESVQTLQSAVDLYGGDLLEGWYQDWCLYERERLQHMYLIMLDKLMGYCEAYHQYEAGLVYGTQILRYDGARERTHRRMMRLYYLDGDRTAALRQYRRCVDSLDEELGVRPAKRTESLCEEIRSDHLGDLRSIVPGPLPATEAATTPLSQVLRHLRHLDAVLVELRRQVQQDIQAVEMALRNEQ